MAKDPAFLFYPNDWLGGTMGMSFEEKGAYIEALMMQFNRGHMTEDMIGHALGQVWRFIQHKFDKDEQGLWYNKRLEEEQEKRKSYTASRSNNIKGKNQHSKKVGHTTSHTTGRMEDEDIYSISSNNYSNYSVNNNNIYNSKIGNFLKNVFEKNNEVENKKYFEMVVVEMNKIWMKHKPEYSFLEEVDYPALLEIAYLIAKRKKISKFDAVGYKESEILKSFEKVSEFLKNTDSKFFMKLPLSGICIPKNFQGIEEDMRSFLKIDKASELEKERIHEEDYFTPVVAFKK